MSKTKKFILIASAALALIALIGWLNRSSIISTVFSPTETHLKIVNTSDLPNPDSNAPLETIVAENLKVPWEIVFLPDGAMLVTQRNGTIEKISPDRKTISTIEGVAHTGEGGLLGMALQPNFAETKRIYLYLTTNTESGLTNRVESYEFENDTLKNKKIILENIPGSRNHDGGRIAFGPDGHLYIATGDAESTVNAQDKNSLAGKILRINADGSIPADNPFGNATYSFGHRNPQGLAWDDQGRLWSTEHGPSGTQTGNDELNLIEKGKNYGWPNIIGNSTQNGLVSPIATSGDDETWAPAGLAHYKGTLLFAGLRGQSLYAGKIKPDNKVDLSVYLRAKYGRLRTVVVGPDGFIYVATSNTDGRGKANKNDDKIIKLNPVVFQ